MLKRKFGIFFTRWIISERINHLYIYNLPYLNPPTLREANRGTPFCDRYIFIIQFVFCAEWHCLSFIVAVLLDSNLGKYMFIIVDKSWKSHCQLWGKEQSNLLSYYYDEYWLWHIAIYAADITSILWNICL